ncbi:MAG: VCBS repeat-containing protein [Acidobacteriota bacterium]
MSRSRPFSLLFACFVLSIAVAGPLRAQLPLEPPATVGAADGPNAVVLADLDRDGDLDAVVAQGPDGTGGGVVFFPFNAGAWGAAVTLDSGFPFAKDLVAVDLDRDGDLDVAAVSFQDDRVAWWENEAGDGSMWSTRRIIDPSANGAVAVAAGDVDGDGDPDLVAALRVAGALRWYENDGSPGDGGWTTRTVNASVFSEATDVDLGDINGDGALDVVAAGRSADEVAWWANDGSPGDGVGGDGNSWTEGVVTSALTAPRALVLEDLDLDGDLDVAVGTATRLVWLARDGAGWSPPAEISLFAGSRHLQATDLDLDGRRDLLGASVDGDRVTWWRNAAAGAFEEHDIDGALNEARGVVAGDLDRDGDVDIVATTFSDDSIELYENRPIHRRASFDEVEVAPDFAAAAMAADVDGDGDLDLIGGGPLTWYERSETSFTARVIDTFAGLTGGQLVHVDAADIDGDGDLDLAGGNAFRLFWWENDGTPQDGIGGGLGTSWTRHPVSDGHSQLDGTAVVDFNRDGAPDLLAFDLTGDQVLWWQNDGTPADGLGGDGNSWTEAVIDGVTASPRAALPRDVDRDGDMDVVVVAQLASQRVSWWRNDAGATSWSQQMIGGGTPLVAAVEDIDADGDLDIVTGSGGGVGGAGLSLIRQLSPGDGSGWQVPGELIGSLPDEPFMTELDAADLDLDGRIDLVGVGDRDRLYWWQNPDDVGGWPREDVSIDQFRADGLRVQDADGDGLPDLIVPSLFASKIVIFRNRAAQAQLIASEVPSVFLEEGEEAALLRINAITLGRVGDNQAEIAALELLLEETPGDPLSGPEASSVLDELRFYEDIDGSGDLDPDVDTLIATLAAPEPDAGALRFELPDFAATIGSANFRSYFLAALMTSDAVAQSVDSLRVTLRTSESRMEDATYDSPLVLFDPEETSTPVLTIENVLFADGFESGDTSRWSSTIIP